MLYLVGAGVNCIAQKDYYWPILNGQLEVKIINLEADTSTPSVMINKSTIENLAISNLDEKSIKLIDFASTCIKLRTTTGNKNFFFPIDLATNEDTPNNLRGCLNADCLTEDNLTIAREFFDNGEVVGFRISVEIETKGGEKKPTTFDIFMQNNEEAKSFKIDQFIRNQIIISKEKSGIVYPYSFAMMVADEAAISDYLMIAEEPAHNNWHFKRFNDEKVYSTDWVLRYIKQSALIDLYNLLANVNENKSVIDDFASDIFKISEPAASGSTKDEPDIKKKKKGVTKEPKPTPPPSQPTYIAIDKDNSKGGFKVLPTKDLNQNSTAILPLKITIHSAYAVIKGRANSFNQYSVLDFDFGSNSGNQFALEGDVEIISKNKNCLVATVKSPNFLIEVTGFDRHRDLFVKVDTESEFL